MNVRPKEEVAFSAASHVTVFRKKISGSSHCIYPKSRPCIPFSSSRNCINALLYSESLVAKIYSEGLLLLPIPSVPPSSSYVVTPSTLHMIRIFPLIGFVFFLFQSLMLLWTISVSQRTPIGSSHA